MLYRLDSRFFKIRSIGDENTRRRAESQWPAKVQSIHKSQQHWIEKLLQLSGVKRSQIDLQTWRIHKVLAPEIPERKHIENNIPRTRFIMVRLYVVGNGYWLIMTNPSYRFRKFALETTTHYQSLLHKSAASWFSVQSSSKGAWKVARQSKWYPENAHDASNFESTDPAHVRATDWVPRCRWIHLLDSWDALQTTALLTFA